MFRSGSVQKTFQSLWKSKLVAQCEGLVDTEPSVPTLVEQADATLEKDKPKIKAPGGYDNVKNTFQGASVNTFDGFRLGASKQVNLNTMVSHFYWIGSQNVPPIYQYRLILPFEDGKLVNISTDVEFSNIDGEFKVPLDAQSSFKLNLSLPQEGYQVAGELELNDESSTTQVSLTNGPSDSNVSVSYMQSVTPFLALGGIGNYSTKSAAITRGFAGTYNDGENMLVTQWDNQSATLLLCSLFYTLPFSPYWVENGKERRMSEKVFE